MTATTHEKALSELRKSGDRLFFQQNGQTISPWHDMPLFAARQMETLNMVVEIPRKSHSKMEISKDDQYNPIKQDVSKGEPRAIADVLPFQGYPCNYGPCNYGALPQTWESPNIVDTKTGIPGDNDPLDVCEIGNQPLGGFAVLDEGETDWKVVAIDLNDPLASNLSDIQDVDAVRPGYLDFLKAWYKLYKVPDGKPENTIALGGRLEDQRCYVEWKKTRTGHPG
ncbi:inorganic pyrophosphatase [Aspergillus caelatus]|uniref:inorganic diphosphatase n=1 Tax=Aspergillus caelatus TaxID=61420 RepID=A0A5N7AN68_9EURO|nr:inorganic pyrophosphatase [Aspergillus caelatus]KAE8370676.1 inorganic pyrophosphatase [Aspergillus caelatus]